jgi:DNA-binding NarL/FixJ family response regulator
MKNESRSYILIADIQFLIIEGLKEFLGKEVGIIESVGSKYELLKALSVHVPDLLIIDYSLMDFDGFNDLKKLKESYPKMGIVILTGSLTRNELIEYHHSGIKNILHKNADADELMACLHAIKQGRKYYSGIILDMMLDFNEKKGIVDDSVQQLTASEIEIVRLIAAGLTTKEIASKKCISFHTVMTHRKNILRKVGVSNASELIMYAVKRGIIDTIEYHI